MVWFFVIPARLVGKIIIIIISSFRISTFKMKNIDHLGEETYNVFGLTIQIKNVNFLV